MHLDKIPVGSVCTLRFWKFCARRGVARPSDQFLLVLSRWEGFWARRSKEHIAVTLASAILMVLGLEMGLWHQNQVCSRFQAELPLSWVIQLIAGHTVGWQ